MFFHSSSFSHFTDIKLKLPWYLTCPFPKYFSMHQQRPWCKLYQAVFSVGFRYFHFCPCSDAPRFVLMVRKGYRDPPYHNWVHAFSVTHFAFLLINNLNLIGIGAIDSLEALALIVSCLCHDLDHRGTTNSFQVRICVFWRHKFDT